MSTKPRTVLDHPLKVDTDEQRWSFLSSPALLRVD